MLWLPTAELEFFLYIQLSTFVFEPMISLDLRVRAYDLARGNPSKKIPMSFEPPNKSGV